MSLVSEEENQKRRAVMREDYLKFMVRATGEKATFEMCEKTKVTATIKAFQPSSDHVIVENLSTPIGIVEKAVLRSSDIVKMSVPIGNNK